MRDVASTAQREQNQSQGLIVGTITLPFRLLGVLIGSLLFSIVVECVGMHLFWKDQGWRHSQQMLQSELGHLSSHFTRSVVVQEPGRTAHELVDTGYEWVFVRSGLLERMSQTAERAHAPSNGQTRNFRYYISQVYVWTESYLIAAAFTMLTFIVRLLVLVLTLPLIFTAAFVGLIDGLVRRDVRRFGAGRESSFIYHRAKASLMPLVVLPWVTYLALPISVHPLLILLPSAALLGWAVSLTAGSFKSISRPSIRSPTSSDCLRPEVALISTIKPLLNTEEWRDGGFNLATRRASRRAHFSLDGPLDGAVPNGVGRISGTAPGTGRRAAPA